MNTDLYNPQHAPAPAKTADLDDQATKLMAAVDEAMTNRVPTSHRDDSPLPQYGPTPPVAQPGRPPMSQKATDLSALMLAAGVASLPVGAAATGILWASGHADPAVVAMICAAPPALVLALSRLMKRTNETVAAAPPVIHQHYIGTVHQEQHTINTNTRGVWARTRNELPR